MKANPILRSLMKAFNVIVVLMMVLNLFSFSATRAAAGAPYNPTFSARLFDNQVHGYGWTLGESVTLTIDDPDNGVGIDYTDVQTVGPADWDANQTWVRFNLNGFTLKPGQFVSMTDGTVTKTHTVAALAVTSVDPQADTVAGTAASGSEINVGWVCENNGQNCAFRHAVTNNSGNWQANFHVVGAGNDEQTLFDIRPGTSSEAAQPDEDGDSTVVNWRVPNPTMDVWYMAGNINAYDWPNGSTVTLNIEDAHTANSPDYTATTQAGPAPWDSNLILANFNLAGQFGLQPGMTVTVSGSSITKTLVIANLTITSINETLDTITGTAGANQAMWIYYNSTTGTCCRNFQANSSGIWSVDYSKAGANGEPIDDIHPGSSGTINAGDEDGDNTSLDWRVLAPFIEASAGSHWAHARDWPNETAVTLTIDNPSNGVGVDKTIQTTVGPAPWNANDILADFNLGNFILKPGFILKVTGGGIERTYTLTDLAITGYDLAADTISGIGEPGVEVQVCANIPNNCVSRYVTPDADGKWTVDYGNPGLRGDEQALVDLQAGNDGWAAQRDANGSTTWADWRVANPYIEANPGNNWIHARDWPDGTAMTLKIDDPNTTDLIDYQTTGTIGPNPNNPGDANDRLADFNLNGFDLKAGFTITVSGAGIERSYIPTDLAITGYDLAADTITGTGKPGEEVQVCANIPNNCISRYATPDTNGDWMVDYSQPGPRDDEKQLVDLTPGQNGWAAQRDDSNNQTLADWRVLNPYIEANPGSNWAHGREWPKGTKLTLTVDDPANGVGVDFSADATMGQAPWNMGDPNDIVADFDMTGFVLKPGQTLHVTDGTTARTYTLTNIAITGYNIAAGTITGTGAPGVQVQICANMPGYCVSRYVTPDANGRWTADYSHPGTWDDEQELVTLHIGADGWAAQRDATGNRTNADFWVPNPYISDIGDLVTNKNTAAGPIAFTVADSDTAATLTITAESSNTTLMPNANIVFGGSGANRTITLTPAANQTGTATITVTVDDGASTTSDTFVLTVKATHFAIFLPVTRK